MSDAPMMTVDFETRSTVNLNKTGVHIYAKDPTTDIWIMAYTFGDEEEVLDWLPGEPVPERVAEHVRAGLPIEAHNAQFERVIWREILGPRYGFPVPALEQWHCSAAKAAALALPRDLDRVARVLNSGVEKDKAGGKIMRQCMVPRKPREGEDPDQLHWVDDPEVLEKLYEYCRDDVRAEREASKRMRDLTPRERELYLLDQRINDRGFTIDTELAAAAQGLAERAMDDANQRMFELTDGQVAGVTKTQKLRDWLADQGVELDSVAKGVLENLDPEELDDTVASVVRTRLDAGKSSTAKLTSMLAAADPDDRRARGLLLYHGAATGRWSGRLIQPQNLPKGTVKGAERFIPAVLAGDYGAIAAEHPVMQVLSSLLRGMLVAAPGTRLLAADFAGIEARVLAWLAGQEDLVRAFANGEPMYERMASRIYGIPEEEIQNPSRERDVGKVTVLGAGYQMGGPKLVKTVFDWTGIEMTEEEGNEAVAAYRAMNHKIKALWTGMENAAMLAMRRPGEVFSAGEGGKGVRYTHRGQYLWAVLPSGRPLAYPLPRVQRVKTPWEDANGEPVYKVAVTHMTVDSQTKQWVRRPVYGGLLAENAVQAISRDLMAESMFRTEAAGYETLLTVHDEIVAEAEDGFGTFDEFRGLMAVVPEWAEGLPLAVSGWEGERYRK